MTSSHWCWVFQMYFFRHSKQCAIWFHYIRDKADISTADTSKSLQHTPKQSRWIKKHYRKDKKEVFLILGEPRLWWLLLWWPVKLYMTHCFYTVVRVSRHYIQLLSDPSRQKLELRRVAASDLAEGFFCSQRWSRATWQGLITVYVRGSIQMQQVEMHFNDFTLGWVFFKFIKNFYCALQQIKNLWDVVVIWKLLTS